MIGFPPETLLQMMAGGGVVGFLVGLTGVGAGALLTPMLISGFGVSPTVAVGTDLLFASITKATAAFRHHKYGNVNWAILRWLCAGSISACVATMAWLYMAAPDTERLGGIIRGLLALLLVASAIIVPLCPWVLRQRRKGADAMDVQVRRHATLSFGLVLGVLVTLTSVGAGAIGVAVLSALYPALAARRIVGTDIVHAIPLAFISGLGHLGLGNVDWQILAALLSGSIPGIALGSRLTGHLPDWLLRIVLSTVLLYAAYLLLPYLVRLFFIM
ncbi:MAG TPA: sulfite exporter TauE/SafE family protein [Hyphomicrobiaceae bacterium]|nr:sulfite exporter TauE/SafE family protein [Hyphomicrobiaceae bacterium]